MEINNQLFWLPLFGAQSLHIWKKKIGTKGGNVYNPFEFPPFLAFSKIQNLPLGPLSNLNLSYASKFKPKTKYPHVKTENSSPSPILPRPKWENTQNFGKMEESPFKSSLQQHYKYLNPQQSLFINFPSPSSKHNHHNQKWRPWLSVKARTKRTSLLSLQSKPTLFLESPHLPPKPSGENLGSLLLTLPTSSTAHRNQPQLPTMALNFPHLQQSVHQVPEREKQREILIRCNLHFSRH